MDAASQGRWSIIGANVTSGNPQSGFMSSESAASTVSDNTSIEERGGSNFSPSELSPLPRSHSDNELASGITREQKNLVREFSSNIDRNPKPHEILPPGDADHGTQGDKLVIAMVGLPARGKTYIAHKLQVFNVGEYRRKMYGAKKPHSWFDPSNEEASQARQICAEAALKDLKDFMKAGMEMGRVGIYDATNVTREFRVKMINDLKDVVQSLSHVILVESVCEDPELIQNNIRAMEKHMPDYQGVESRDEVVADFTARIQCYAARYEPLGEEDKAYSWIKTVDGGQQVILNKIFGYLPGRIASFVMNLHTSPKEIYLSRHGQSEYNLLEKIGGDSSLTAHGEEYALALSKHIHQHVLPKHPRARLWTSTLKRTIETGEHIRHEEVLVDGKPWITMRPRQWHALDEIHAGIFDGMTYREIEAADPEEFAMRKKNKLGYRYPRGESYLDVLQRLDTIIHEMERQLDPILIISHQGILRILYAYLMTNEVGTREESPYVAIPLNTIKILRPHAYGCTCESICLVQSKAGPDGQTEKMDPPSH